MLITTYRGTTLLRNAKNQSSRKSQGRVKRRKPKRSRILVISSRIDTDATKGTTSLTRRTIARKSQPLLQTRNPKRVRVRSLLLPRPLTLPNHQQISLVKRDKIESSSSVASSTTRMMKMITSLRTMVTTTMMTITTTTKTTMRITTMKKMT